MGQIPRPDRIGDLLGVGIMGQRVHGEGEIDSRSIATVTSIRPKDINALQIRSRNGRADKIPL